MMAVWVGLLALLSLGELSSVPDVFNRCDIDIVHNHPPSLAGYPLTQPRLWRNSSAFAGISLADLGTFGSHPVKAGCTWTSPVITDLNGTA